MNAMKRIIVFTLLLMMTIISSSAKVIKTHFVKTRQQGGARNVLPLVIADQEMDDVTVEVSRYCGTYAINIYNEQGMLVSCTDGVADGVASSVLDIVELPSGNYTLEIVLDNMVYTGEFYIMK